MLKAKPSARAKCTDSRTIKAVVIDKRLIVLIDEGPKDLGADVFSGDYRHDQGRHDMSLIVEV